MNVSRLTLNQFLMLSGTGVAAIILLPLGVYFILSILNIADRTIESHGKSLAGIVSTQVIEPLLVEDPLSLLDTLEKVVTIDKNIRYVCIHNASGEIVSHTFRGGFPPDLQKIWEKSRNSFIKFKMNDEPLVDVSAPIMSGQLGAVHIGFSRRYAQESMMSLLVMMGFGMAGSLLLISAIAWIVSVKVSRPIRILEGEVSRFIPSNTPEPPLALKGTREVESLARGFNEMVLRVNALEYERSVIQTKMIHTECLSALGEMAAGMTHEIRNPLDGVLECIRYLEADPNKGERQTKFLPMIREGLQRINDVMNHMLMFARTGSALSTEVCYTADIISTLEVLLRGKLNSQRIRLTWQKPGACQCLCNKQAVLQALLNLVLNAMEAVRERESPEILIEAVCDSHWVNIFVEDNGKGVSPGLEGKIFESFYTTKPLGKGTGLGLPISRQLVRAAGGDLILHSCPASLGGARFEIKIPRVYQKDYCSA
ncbi:MAG: sensor histidine kinase [Candidatus Latescibacterota bacterium]